MPWARAQRSVKQLMAYRISQCTGLDRDHDWLESNGAIAAGRLGEAIVAFHISIGDTRYASIIRHPLTMIFLTGASGLLGLHILDELRTRGLPVTALIRDSRSEHAVLTRGATPMYGQVEDQATWDAVGSCSTILHAAAIIAGRFSWNDFLRVNVQGTQLAAARARQLGARLVHVSSVAVYGHGIHEHPPVDETATPGPLLEREYYARSKRMAEEAVWAEARKGLAAVAIRPCVIYGEGDRLFLPGIVRAMRAIVPLIGKGDRPLTLVYARHVAQAVVLAAVTPAVDGRIYNVANDGEIDARGFVAAVGRGLGRKIRTIRVPSGPAMAGARLADRVVRLFLLGRYPGSLTSAARFWRGGNPYSSDRARRDLGWNPKIRHEEAIERAVRALL